MQSKSYPGADCESDHVLVICQFRLKLRKMKTPKHEPKLDFNKLLKDSNLKNQYTIEVKNKFDALTEIDETNLWENFKESLVSIAKDIIPKEVKQSML